MLGAFFRRFQRKASSNITEPKKINVDDIEFHEAKSLLTAGKQREAIPVLQLLLERYPDNAQCRVWLGVCYRDIGDAKNAAREFEVAYGLDDMDPAIVANHATMLIESGQHAEAHKCLNLLAATSPDFGPLFAVYAALNIELGNAKVASRATLRAWMANFGNLRAANCYLLNSTYACLSERDLAKEHFFWAQTLADLPAINPKPEYAVFPSIAPELSTAYAKGREAAVKKIRLAYWSPDFRNHSVHFFFNPLLKAHDRVRFEIHLLHDSFVHDDHTEYLKLSGDHFHDVYSLTDQQLRDFLHSQRFDILVELAGHTSINRVNLLKDRYAPLQITALGYPPTTGLTTVDYKLLDRFTYTGDANIYYAEKPLVLPTSFWCFDPMQPAELAQKPPVELNGYVTFACVGNLSKISDELLDIWCQILRQVQKSRLQIRAIPFSSEYVVEQYKARLSRAGVPLDRVDLLGPLGVKDLFKSYNDIDIVLDTYPFNGGTTTSFAVYMGVPVVSRYGESLVSRMGLSILSNSGMPDLVSSTWGTYVDNAVRLAGDISRLRQIKHESRAIMQGNALGNGEMFAREFEQACSLALSDIDQRSSLVTAVTDLPTLAAKESMSRAFSVLQAGNQDAAVRIHDQVVKHYGQSAATRIFQFMCTPAQIDLEEPAAVEEALVGLDAEDAASLLLFVTRKACLDDRIVDANWALSLLDATALQNPTDRQTHLMLQEQLALEAETLTAAEVTSSTSYNVDCAGSLAMHANGVPVSLLVVMVSPEPREVEWLDISTIQDGVGSIGIHRVKVISVAPEARWKQMMQESAGFTHTALVHNHVSWDQPLDLTPVLSLLSDYDMVGISGCRRWKRLRWAYDDAEQCAGLVIRHSAEVMGRYELANLATDFSTVVGNLAVLDCAILFFQSKLLEIVSPPEDDGGLLSDTAWTAACAKAGCRLAVSGEIDVVLGAPNVWGSSVGQQLAVEALIHSNGFDLIEEGLNDKRQQPSVVCASLKKALALRRRLHNYAV